MAAPGTQRERHENRGSEPERGGKEEKKRGRGDGFLEELEHEGGARGGWVAGADRRSGRGQGRRSCGRPDLSRRQGRQMPGRMDLGRAEGDGCLDREPEDGAGGFSVGNRGGKGSREI